MERSHHFFKKYFPFSEYEKGLFVFFLKYSILMDKNNYAQFSITDFVCDDVFLNYHLSPTETNTFFWNEWLQQNPAKRSEWEQAEQLLEAVRMGLSDYTRTYLSPEAEAHLLGRIQATIALLNDNETPIVPIWRRTWLIRSAAAACVLLICGVWYFNQSPPSVYQQEVAALKESVIEKTNESDKPIAVVLPDGSEVVLTPKSRVAYPINFIGDSRTVYLSGEATFSVVKDFKKPFYVHANEIVTKVLGTKFAVRAFEKDKDVVVTVQSGQVSVYNPIKKGTGVSGNQKTRGVLLLPNQQAVFERLTEQFKKSLVAQPVLIEIPGLQAISFEFNETPVIEALQRIKKAYGIDIVFNTEVLKGCEITASLNGESLFEKLDVLTQTINGSYEIVEGQIVVTTKGCQ